MTEVEISVPLCDNDYHNITSYDLNTLIEQGFHISEHIAEKFVINHRYDLFSTLVTKTTSMPKNAFSLCYGNADSINMLMSLNFIPQLSDLSLYCRDNIDFLIYAFSHGIIPSSNYKKKYSLSFENYRETIITTCIYNACQSYRLDILSLLFSQKEADGSPVFYWSSIENLLQSDATAVYMLLTYAAFHPEVIQEIFSYKNLNLRSMDDILYFINTSCPNPTKILLKHSLKSYHS